MRLRFLLALTALAVGIVAAPIAATPNVPHVADWAVTDNLTAIGFSPRIVPLDNNDPENRDGNFNSDLAFQGDVVVQGTYAGFRLIDVSKPGKPKEIVNWEECASGSNTQGNQGDVIVWENLIIRSWNSAAGSAGSMCGDMPVAQGEEGVHVIDISNPTDPNVVAFVDIPCGSHTETLVPDLANNRLLVYSNSSANTIFGGTLPPDSPPTCRGFDIIEVPLANPAAASYLKFVPAGPPGEPLTSLHPCHDTAVMLADVNLVACAGSSSSAAGPGVNVFSIGPPGGGSKDDPLWLYQKVTGGISLGHSAAFTYDGEVIVVGHEPGGGSGANCEATDNPLERTFFFVAARTGESLGQFTIPRPQTNVENCTTHNYNIVPMRNKEGKPRYVMVSGNYQSGISVIDFSDPANATEIAYADPPPLVDPNPPVGIELGGDWSTYWYNGRIYESDITRGLTIWRIDDPAISQHVKETRSNPQTTTFRIKAGWGHEIVD